MHRGSVPPLPPGLPADAAKHAAALWSFLDELAEDPQACRVARARMRVSVGRFVHACHAPADCAQAYQEFLEKQAAAAGVDLPAFRERLSRQQRGANAASSAAGSATHAEQVLAAMAAEPRDGGGAALPPDLLARLVTLGAPSSGVAGDPRTGATSQRPGADAAKAPHPLVEELPPAVAPSPAGAGAKDAASLAPRRAPATPSVSVEAPCDDAPHGTLVVSAQLLDVASAAEVVLEASEEELVLLRAGAPPDAPPLLTTRLPALCLPDDAMARWDKRARRLTVRLPCAPLP